VVDGDRGATAALALVGVTLAAVTWRADGGRGREAGWRSPMRRARAAT
jgi:hypothetical protein